jgi:capsular exopolysaccharide synthesis family protein
MNQEIKEPSGQMTISDGSRVFIIPSEKEMAGESVEVAKDEDKIAELLAYLQIFKKYKWWIIGLSLLTAVFTASYSKQLQLIYSSTARLLIEFDKANIISIQDISATSSANKDYFYTQLEILKSRILAERLVDQLNLVSHPAFNPARQPQGFNWYQWLPIPSSWLPPPSTEVTDEKPSTEVTDEKKKRAVVNAVMAGLSINPVVKTQLVEISFESPYPKLAADIANTLADIYIEYDLETKLEMTQKAANWLTKRLNKLRQELKQSEEKLQNYMEEQNLVDVAGIKSVAVKELEETATNLLNARQELVNKERVYKQIRAFQAGTTQFESIPAILNNPLIQGVKQAELAAKRKVNELKERYGQKHPQIRAANAELEAAIANKNTQTQLVIDGIIKEYEMAAANVKSLERSFNEKKENIQFLSRKEVQLKILERDVEVNRQLYNLFLTRFKETNASQDIQALQSTVGRIVEPALVPVAPFKPNKKVNVVMGFAFGLFLATLFAFIVEFLNNTIKSGEEVEQKLGLPLLGILPKMKLGKKDENPYFMFFKKTTSEFSEAVRSIRTGIMLTGIDNPNKVLIVTSSVASEGKSTVSINQAFALGQIGKTLLIEADMRRPSLANKLKWRTDTSGLSELVAGRIALDDCIHHSAENESIDIIPCGVIPPNPLELFSSERFKEVLKQLYEYYQYIVIDTAPVMSVSDALVVAKSATAVSDELVAKSATAVSDELVAKSATAASDKLVAKSATAASDKLVAKSATAASDKLWVPKSATAASDEKKAKFATEIIYVVKANVTPYKVVLDGLKRLRKVNVPVRNIVLNFDTKKTSDYYKSDYQGAHS